MNIFKHMLPQFVDTTSWDANGQIRRHGGQTAHFGGPEHDVHPTDRPQFTGNVPYGSSVSHH